MLILLSVFCDVHNVPLATNLATAELLIKSRIAAIWSGARCINRGAPLKRIIIQSSVLLAAAALSLSACGKKAGWRKLIHMKNDHS